MDPRWIMIAGLGIGFVAALSADTVLVLIEAIWQRRPRSVALAAIFGAALADLALIGLGGWAGWLVATSLGSPATRATVAVGLFLGLAGKAFLTRVLLGAKGVPGNSQLPVRASLTFGRFVAIELLVPTPAILAAAVIAAWPGLWAADTAGPFVVAVVAGGVVSRLVWATGGQTRRGKWGSRAIREASTILTVGLLVGLAVAAFPR